MQFLLIILDAPGSGAASASALRFARAAMAAGHVVRQVFFHADGAHAAAPPEIIAGEPDLEAGWRELAAAGIPLLACTTAMTRRGVDARPTAAVQPGSLAQLSAALEPGSRLITFAN
jgi:tRNA 2-thiouridine synthesizing protein D